MYDLFYNDNYSLLNELSEYIKQNFSKSHSYNRMRTVIDNYSVILEDVIEEEEVSSDEDMSSKPRKKKKSSGGSIFDSLLGGDSGSSDTDGGFNFADGLLGNSSIGKLAKEISEEIDPKDIEQFKDINNPGELMQKMFSSTGDGSTGFGSIMNKIISKVGTKLNDGSIDKDSMTNEASNIMKSFGGNALFSNMFNNMNNMNNTKE